MSAYLDRPRRSYQQAMHDRAAARRAEWVPCDACDGKGGTWDEADGLPAWCDCAYCDGMGGEHA